jgi:hypothetical protein
MTREQVLASGGRVVKKNNGSVWGEGVGLGKEPKAVIPKTHETQLDETQLDEPKKTKKNKKNKKTQMHQPDDTKNQDSRHKSPMTGVSVNSKEPSRCTATFAKFSDKGVTSKVSVPGFKQMMHIPSVIGALRPLSAIFPVSRM